MKIGIMSMQRIKNYGSFMQAYGLKTILKELGYNDIEFIDYKIGKVLPLKVNVSFFKKTARKIKKILLFYKYSKMKTIVNKFNYRYNSEFLKILNISDERNYNHDIDYWYYWLFDNCLCAGVHERFSASPFGSAGQKTLVLLRDVRIPGGHGRPCYIQ